MGKFKVLKKLRIYAKLVLCHVMENTIKQTVGKIAVNNYELLEGAEQNIAAEVMLKAEVNTSSGSHGQITIICENRLQ